MSALHDFGAVGAHDDARSPFMKPDDPKINQPPHIVPGKTSIGFGIPVTFHRIVNHTSCF